MRLFQKKFKSLLTDLKTTGIPSLVVGPIPVNFFGPSSILFGLSESSLTE